MRTDFEKWLVVIGLMLFFTLLGFAQDSSPTPTPPDEKINILTEEVRLNVTAQYSNGKFVPNLTADDLLIVESGDPQTITSMKRVPANVLLLLDTGSELNFVKSTATTRITAKILIANLEANDSLAVVQYNDKIETVADWIKKSEFDLSSLDNKLFSGRRSRFAEAVNAAIAIFKSRPTENRHLVLISDGAESVADEVKRRQALQNLLAAGVTIHIISYTQLEEQSAKQATRRIRIEKEKTPPRIPDYIMDIILQTLPYNERKILKALNESQRLIVITLDNKMIKVVRQKHEVWRKNEIEFRDLANDSGGVFQAPESLETMWGFAVEVAHAVDANYVITYTPKTPIAESPNNEPRKIRVGTHRNGVQIRSRQKIVTN